MWKAASYNIRFYLIEIHLDIANIIENITKGSIFLKLQA